MAAFRKSVSLGGRLKSILDKYRAKFDALKNFETPEKLRGTFLERWGRYWKALCLEYGETVADVAKGCRERPVRASVYFSVLGGCYYLAKHNPDEDDFREQLLERSIKLMQVGEPIRNPTSVQHLEFVERCYNEGLIRRLNVGVLSFIWLDDYERACAIYKAVCPYLKPEWFTFHERIVDVGFLDKWWVLERKMTDYDVNESEFPGEISVVST